MRRPGMISMLVTIMELAPWAAYGLAAAMQMLPSLLLDVLRSPDSAINDKRVAEFAYRQTFQRMHVPWRAASRATLQVC